MNEAQLQVVDAVARGFDRALAENLNAIASRAILHSKELVFQEIKKVDRDHRPVKCPTCGYERTVWKVCPMGCDTSTLI